MYDVAIVFGGLPERAEKAYELYRQGKVKKVLLSGGVGNMTALYDQHADKEVNEYLRLAEQYYVPHRDLIVEDQAANTKENAANATRLLFEQGYDLDQMKIVAVSSDFHIKRCLRELAKYVKPKNLF